MSPEERQLLTGLFDRIRNAAGQPRDREAETLIADQVRSQPYAPYLLAQTVIVQEQALRAANDKINELETRVRDLESHASRSGSGGFLGGLFGGGAASSPPPPSRTASPPPSAGPWGGAPQGGGWGSPQSGPFGGGMGAGPMGGAGGGGFLKGALGAAAGVAGGVLLADSIRGLFHGGHNPMGIGTGFSPGLGGAGASPTTVNNYYGDNNDDGGYAAASSDDATISDADYTSDDGGYSSDDDGGYA